MKSIPEYSFRKQNISNGFEIQKISYLFKEHDLMELTSAHRLKFYALIVPTKGSGVHQINFKEHPFKNQDLIFIGKDDVHVWKDWGNSDGYILLFTQGFLNQNQTSFNDLTYSFPFNPVLYNPLIQISDEQNSVSINSLVNLIYLEFNSLQHRESKEIIQCLLRAIFLKVRAESNELHIDANKKKKLLFIRLQHELDENISITRNANDYSKKLNVSYKELNDVCKVFTNNTIKVFIDEITIFKAKKYLIEPDKNISITAYMLGFEEVTNFTKFFKKHTGRTPKKFIVEVS